MSDVARFDRRAAGYDRELLQERLFVPVQRATLDVAASLVPEPASLLDVGCGTGSLLRLAAERFPAARLAGVDPSAAMLAHARAGRAELRLAAAERLPFADGAFELVVTTLSFHHWADQRRGVAEAARVLAPGGVLAIADLLAAGLVRPVAAVLGRRARIHTASEIDGMLAAAGLEPIGSHCVFAVAGVEIVSAVCAHRP